MVILYTRRKCLGGKKLVFLHYLIVNYGLWYISLFNFAQTEALYASMIVTIIAPES